MISLSDVTITESRWQIVIRGKNEKGEDVEYIASADSSLADSGIWFGTREDLEEVSNGLW